MSHVEDWPWWRGDPLSLSPNARKTECKRRHPFDPVNTYVRWDGSRGCRACHREQSWRTRRCKPAGHLLDAANTYVRWDGRRMCRACGHTPQTTQEHTKEEAPCNR